MQNKKRIAVAMSGGVDSSVAAKLLHDQGHEVVGIFLRLWRMPINDKNNKADSSAEALSSARRAAAKIGVPLQVLNFSKIFKKQVVDNFLDEYKKGRTPNPCVRCNKLVKLGFLIKQAKKLGFDFVATGHYANLKQTGKKFSLRKAKDKSKDQSYFLYTLNQNELKHLIFPLGGYTKTQVRGLAKKFKLPTAEKPESQEICFIPGKSHNEFLKRHLKLRPGKIKTLDEKVVGAHQGLALYTIGQRKGIKIGGTGPYYAAKMDYKTNILYVVNSGNDKILYNNKLTAKNVNWLAGVAPKPPFKCQAVIRYGHQPEKCVVAKINKNNYQVKFAKAQRAIAPGQSVVFYSGQEVLGGGIICQN
ncbi:MAG: tRNA 2-thiouridine(34) synthase MnmA [Patescibacteria group bacterium]